MFFCIYHNLPYILVMKHIMETTYGYFYSHSSIAKLARVMKKEIEALWTCSLKKIYFSVVILTVSLSLRRRSAKRSIPILSWGRTTKGKGRSTGSYS